MEQIGLSRVASKLLWLLFIMLCWITGSADMRSYPYHVTDEYANVEIIECRRTFI